MENKGVRCNVKECRHNVTCCQKCNLDMVEITDEKTGANAVATPHFCKSYQEK